MPPNLGRPNLIRYRPPPLAALLIVKPRHPLCCCTPGYLSFECRSRLPRSPFVSNHPRSPAAALLQPPFLGAPVTLPPFNSMSDFGPISIHTDCTGRCSHSPILLSCLPHQQPDYDADRAIEYLSLKARQLSARALALDPHARPCPSFSSAKCTYSLVVYVCHDWLPNLDYDQANAKFETAFVCDIILSLRNIILQVSLHLHQSRTLAKCPKEHHHITRRATWIQVNVARCRSILNFVSLRISLQ